MCLSGGSSSGGEEQSAGWESGVNGETQPIRLHRGSEQSGRPQTPAAADATGAAAGRDLQVRWHQRLKSNETCMTLILPPSLYVSALKARVTRELYLVFRYSRWVCGPMRVHDGRGYRNKTSSVCVWSHSDSKACVKVKWKVYEWIQQEHVQVNPTLDVINRSSNDCRQMMTRCDFYNRTWSSVDCSQVSWDCHLLPAQLPQWR